MNNEKEKIKIVYNDANAEAEQRFTDHFIKWNEYKENRDQPIRFLSKNGINRNIRDYITDSVDRFNEYFPKPSHKKDWQSNTFEPVTRDKIIAILGRMVSTRLSVGLELKSRSLIDMDQAEERRQIFSDLLQSANNKNDDDTARVWEAFVALSQGTVIGYESWKKEAREVEYVKEVNPDTGEKKTEKVTIDKWDDVYGCKVPVLEFYPETIWVNNMVDLKRCFWVSQMKYTRFMDEFGKFENAKNVKEAGYYFGLDGYENWGISQDVKSTHVEVIRFYDEVDDKYGIWANGVEIYYGCMPWNHKVLPFWHSIGEPINEDFFYGKSIADKLMSMQDLNNALLNGMLDQLYLSLKSPIFISGELNDDIRDGYLEPDRVYTAEQGTTVSKPMLGAIDQNAFNMLNLIKRSMESSSISEQAQGIATGGRKTRYEVQTLQEGALTIAGLFVVLLENALKRKYWLRMKNILQYYSMPRKDKNGKAKFKFIVLNDTKLTNGKIGKKMIEIVGDDTDLNSPEGLAQVGASMEGLTEYNPATSRIQPIQITREWLLNDEFDFEMTIAPFSSVKDSELDRKNKDIQFYQLTNGDPMFDQEMNKKDLARAFGKDPRIVKNEEEVQPVAGQEGFDPTKGLPSLDEDIGLNSAL